MDKLYLLFILIFVTSCKQNKPTYNEMEVSIHKDWKFIKYQVITRNPNEGVLFSSNDKTEYLDLTDKNILKFFDKGKSSPEAFQYKINGSIISMKEKNETINYKIWKLTADQLELVINTDEKEPNANLITMVFKEM